MNNPRFVCFCATRSVWGTLAVVMLATLSLPGATPPAAPAPLPFRVSARLADTAEILAPSAVHLDGWLGNRIALNEKNRLLAVDTEPLLAGYKRKPGSHPWIGEHVGKWLHAATLAWANTGDPALRAKLDRVAAELVAAQEPDGYLGTYLPDQRFGLFKGADWDGWAHKYCLIPTSRNFWTFVLARCAKRAVAIPLDCFVAPLLAMTV